MDGLNWGTWAALGLGIVCAVVGLVLLNNPEVTGAALLASGIVVVGFAMTKVGGKAKG